MIRQAFVDVVKYVALGEVMSRLYRMPSDPNYRATIETYIKNRESNFLAIAKGVLANRRNPYSQLFEIAGCTFADLEAGVKRSGLEATLSALLKEGVYLTLDEFRCNTEIVRGGKHIPATMKDWDTSAGGGGGEAQSSGSSSGKPQRTRYSLEYAKFGNAGGQLMRDAFGEPDGIGIIVVPILPTNMGLGSCIGAARMGYRVERWFALGSSGRNLHYKAITAALVTRLRMAGAKIPFPTYLDQGGFSPVAEFIARRKREGVRSNISGMVSSLTRIAAAAIDRGLDIRGTAALVGGESLTDAKRELIEAAGIEVFPMYGTSEFGGIGMSCRQMNTGNRVHVSIPTIALVSRRIDDGCSDEPVDSLHITSLLSFAPRTLINVEIGDTGVIEPATCDCVYSRMGYKWQVRDIAAISKIRGQGYTLRAPEIVKLLEEGLAAKFGGRPGDYQLAEVEGKAQTEMVLRIHPRAGVKSPEKVLEYFLAECRRTYGGSMTILQWTESNGVRAEVVEPVLAATGKFRAIRLLGASQRAKAVPESKPMATAAGK
ncbi:MAG TPA: hypothetical protein VMH05_13350 [Bryobacteraceae bacterium]|nr:hypothetical protein [Bryobacteraceae bacterium]